MPERQIHLFLPWTPLADRLSEDFFRAVPRCPGVYVMTGDDDRVLYVGQSGNLRARLASYKRALPDRAPRKVIRLIHAVRRITWETCPTPEAARVRENELLRLHRPRFNRMNTYPYAYNFFWLRAGETGVEIGRSPRPEPDAEWFGAFKGGALAAYASLLRLLWAAEHRPTAPSDFPLHLLGPKPPRSFRVQPARHEWLQDLRSFLSGTGDALLSRLQAAVPPAETLGTFHRALQTQDFETLAAFFAVGPQRNRRFCQEHNLADGIVPQEQLDDLRF
jgi:excinuclease UvrABC nuclease subunit